MDPHPDRTRTPRRTTPTEIHGRKDGPNIALAKAMGSTRGYDPIPPSQYEWQAAEGEPPLYRMWSWFCQHTIAFGKMSPFAVRADGQAATLKDCAADLQLDLGEVSNLFKRGVQAGLWRRKNGRELYFSGDVTAAQVIEANKRRQVECTLNLSSRDLLIIKNWPKDMQDRFTAIWTAAQEHHRVDLARSVAERRAQHAEIDRSIRRAFPLPEKRIAPANIPQPVELPQVIVEVLLSVQTTIVHSSPVERTVGEENGENVSVPAAASLCVSEVRQKALPASASSVPDEEIEYLVAALQIDADAACKLLMDCRKVTPEVTWREVLELCRMKLKQVKPKRNATGLLLSSVPGMAKGALLEAAREQALTLMIQTAEGRNLSGVALTDAELAIVRHHQLRHVADPEVEKFLAEEEANRRRAPMSEDHPPQRS